MMVYVQPDIEQHPDGNFPGKCTLLFPVNILSRNRDARSIGFLDRRCQRRERRRNDDVTVFDI